MKRWLIYFILLLQCFFAACASAEPNIPPKPSAADGIYVQDYAGVLSPEDRRRLLSLGQELDSKTTAQLAVVTVKSLDGQSIEDYALAILRNWGIGSRDKNNGALILVAVQDRRSRIEVGYGLEGVLTDGLTGRIQDQAMLPYFRKGNYAAGIVNGYAATAAIIAKDAGVQLQGLSRSPAAVQGQNSETGSEYPLWVKLLIGAGIVLLLIIDNLFLGGIITQMLFLLILRGRGGGGFGGGRGGFGGGSGGGGGSSRSW